jgi:hypothetical protein
MFPPVPPAMVERGYADFADRWNPILDVFDEASVRFAHEVHPSETCRGATRDGAGTSSRPGTGTSCGSRCFRMLNAIGFDGPISVEWEDTGMDRLVGGPDALALIRRLTQIEPLTAAFDAAFSSRD